MRNEPGMEARQIRTRDSPRMKRPFFLTVALAAIVSPILMGTGYRMAPVLPEVRNHLESAHKFLDEGDHARAEAHASVVLVREEIKVAVQFEDVEQDDRRVCEEALQNAFETWQDALGGHLIFKRVAADQAGDVLVRFRPDVRMGREAVAGFVNWKRTVRTKGKEVVEASYSANMQLRTRNLNGRPMSVAAMHHEACHELGHVLGLDDQDAVGTLMGPLDPREVAAQK
ncbi:matrixin family metalloprotease [bacterium]|nr:MAG: matrixin family metalloprotease [bacterium]